MTNKDIEYILLDWCEKANLQQLGDDSKISLFTGERPQNYFLPLSMLKIDSEVNLAWFAEIWIGSTCCFRESCLLNSSDPDRLKMITMMRLMQSIFNHAIFAKNNYLKKLKDEKEII